MNVALVSVVVIVCYTNGVGFTTLPMQSVPITIRVVNSNPTHALLGVLDTTLGR